MAKQITPGQQRLLARQRLNFSQRSQGIRKPIGVRETPEEYNQRVYRQSNINEQQTREEVISSLNASAIRSGSTRRFSTAKDQEGTSYVKTYVSPRAEQARLRKEGFEPVASSREGGVIYARNPEFQSPPPSQFSAENPRVLYIRRQEEAEISRKQRSTFLGVPDPVGRTEGYLLRREQEYVAQGGRGATFLGSKRRIYGVEYDKLRELEASGKNPGAAYGLSSGTLRSISDPLSLPATFATGYGFGRGAGYVSNFVGARKGYGAYRATQAGFAITGIGASAYGVNKAYKEEGYSGVGRAGVTLIVGAGGAAKGFAASRPGVFVEQIRADKPGTFESRFIDEKTLAGAGERTLVADVSVFGQQKSISFNQKILVAGGRSSTSSPYSVIVSGYGGFKAGGKQFGFGQNYEGFVTPRRTALVNDRGLVYASRSGRPKVFSEVDGEAVYSTPTEFASFKPGGKEIISGGRGVSLTQDTTYTQRTYSLYRPTVVESGYDPFEQRPTLFTSKGDPVLAGFSSEVKLSRAVYSSRQTGRAVVSSKLTDPSVALLRGGGYLRQNVVRPSLISNKKASLGSQQLSEYIIEPRTQGGRVSTFDLPGFPAPQTPVLRNVFAASIYGRSEMGSIQKSSNLFRIGGNNGLITLPGQRADSIGKQNQISTPFTITRTSQRQRTQQLPVQDFQQVFEQKNPFLIVPGGSYGGFVGAPPLGAFPFGIPPSRNVDYGGVGRDFSYTPSLLGILGGRTTTKAPSLLGGFEIRPIISRTRRKKK